MRYFILKFGLSILPYNKFQRNCDLSLITLWQQGEEAAFDVLYKRYVLQLLGLISQKIDSYESAKELAQDVFLAVYLQKNELNCIENFRAYLFAIAKKKVFNYYRHELVKQKYQRNMMLNGNEHLTDNVNEMLENKELYQIIYQQIEQLPPKCREVFKLSREENLSYKSIAQRLNISENTVDQHIQKALRILRTARQPH
jgi:RNA polymerase sigma-70 factor (family 1)